MSTSPLVRAGIIRSEAGRLRGLEDERERARIRFAQQTQALEAAPIYAAKFREALTAGLPERDRLNSLLNTQEEDRARQQQAQQAQQQAFDGPSRDATAQQRRLTEAQRSARQAQAEIQQVQQAQQRQMQRQLQDQAFDARTAPQQQMQSDAYRERLGQIAEMQQASGRSGSLIAGDLYDAPKLTPEEFNRRLKLIEGTGDLTPEQLEIRSALATAEPGQSVSFFYNGKFITRADLPNNGLGIVPDGVELVLPPSETGARAGLPTSTETVTPLPRDEEAVRSGTDPELNLGGGTATSFYPSLLEEAEAPVGLPTSTESKTPDDPPGMTPRGPAAIARRVILGTTAVTKAVGDATRKLGRGVAQLRDYFTADPKTEAQRQAQRDAQAALEDADRAAIYRAAAQSLGLNMGDVAEVDAAAIPAIERYWGVNLDERQRGLIKSSVQVTEVTDALVDKYVSDDDMFETPLGATSRPASVASAVTSIAKTKPGDMLKRMRAVDVKEPASVRNAREAYRLLGEVAAAQIDFFANTLTYENLDQTRTTISKLYGDAIARRTAISQGLLGAYSEAAISAGDPVRAARFISDALGYDVQVVPSGDDFQILVGGQVEGVYASKDKLMQRLKTMADPKFAAQLSATQEKLMFKLLDFNKDARLESLKQLGRLELERLKQRNPKNFKFKQINNQDGTTTTVVFDTSTGFDKVSAVYLPDGTKLSEGDYLLYLQDREKFMEAWRRNN